MKYDFDTQINRRGSYSLKWDVPEGELPMWVADMDFVLHRKSRKQFAKGRNMGFMAIQLYQMNGIRPIGAGGKIYIIFR